MGSVLGKISDHSLSVSNILANRRKRKLSLKENEEANTPNDDENSPKKKKLLTTTQYIYKALFKDQLNTDISILALGKIWNLHKVYLSQSPYFNSMFNGSWKEATQNFIDIKIIDDKITVDSLDAVFGSLYSDEIIVDADSVVSILATGTLFHLESIIEKCAEVMIENICDQNVISYYEAACEYGRQDVKKEAFKWLEMNILTLGQNKMPAKILSRITIDLMTELVKSPFLYVIQTEYSLYSLLRCWMFTRVNPSYSDPTCLRNYDIVKAYSDPTNLNSTAVEKKKSKKDLLSATTTASTSTTRSTASSSMSSEKLSTARSESDLVSEYFQKRREKKVPFLFTDEGREYMRPFLALRTQYLVNHSTDLQIVLNDNIIPKSWVNNHVLHHWNSVLRNDHVLDDHGPQNLDEETFNKYSMRCGRQLQEPGYHKWRWTGFNFGVDLVFILNSRVLSIRRHHRPEHERLLSFKTNRQFMIRVEVSSVNEQKRVLFKQTSEIMSLALAKNAEVSLMLMDTKLVHPLMISVNILLVRPGPDFKENLVTADEQSFNIYSMPISEIGANSIYNSEEDKEGRNNETAKMISRVNCSGTAGNPLMPSTSSSSLPLSLGLAIRTGQVSSIVDEASSDYNLDD